MKRLCSVLAAIGLALAPLVLVQTEARANGENWRITDYNVQATVDDHGTTSVHLALSFDFGNDPGHGPYLTFPLRQEIANDPDHWRMLTMTVGEVSSPSGADASVQTTTQDGNLLIRVGSEGRTFTGVQTYQVDYTIRGLIAPAQAQSGLDEFNWNPVGTGWEVPIDSATVALTGPATILRAACYSGDYFDLPCDAAVEGDSATYAVTQIGNGSGMQVVAGFPSGTFVGAEPVLERRYGIGNMFPVTPWTAGVAGVLSALGLALVFRRTRRSARDEVYLGLTPGVVPAPGQETTIGYQDGEVPVAVQFTPPKGARPGELGTLTDATADNRDITATVIDLAVRGHLSIAQTGKRDWTFTRNNGGDQLVAYESQLLNRLFSAGGQVTTDDLKEPEYAGLMSEAKGALHRRVTTDLKWFTANPATVRGLAFGAGIVLVAAGVGVGFLFGLFGWGLVGVAGVVTGLAVIALNNRFGSRTASGSAVLAQTRGFELYLRTAEADQIRFEEGIDVFSRYLPYAIMFGVAERWTKVFSELADQGRYTFSTPWYYGYGYGFAYHNFASSLDSLSGAMTSSLQSATAATSGGSGFSGGGGFGGGGGGGW